MARLLTVGACVASLVSLAGCWPHSPAASQATITVDPQSALFDAGLAITVSGAPAGAEVTMAATSSDSVGMWSSQATFRADNAGRLDLATVAPVSGSYSGIHPTGLLWSMVAPTGSTEPSFSPAGDSYQVNLRVSVDTTVVASTVLTRLTRAAGVRSQTLSLATDGIVGQMFTPADTTHPHPAVLVVGGSEGGLHTQMAAAFASHGYPALAVAYFGEPGLPSSLSNIPLEYFAKALAVLARASGVDSGRIVVAGTSRGSEAALLLGVHYPNLVHAVIALVPSSVVNPGLPATTPAWTWHDTAIPFVPMGLYGQPTPAGAPDAVIPVEKIAGPVLLVCGVDDELWPSCPYSDAIMARLNTHGFGYPHIELKEVAAGHLVGAIAPNLATRSGTLSGTRYGTLSIGGDQQHDALGRLDAWPRTLDFLGQLP